MKGGDTMAIEATIKSLREAKGLSMAKVAAALALPKGTYASYEYGHREPGIEVLLKLADFYGVTVDYLLGREPKNPMLELPTKPVGDDEFVKMYESLPTFAKEIFVEVMAKLSKAAQENIRQQKKEEKASEKPPIQVQIRQGQEQEQAIARTSDPDKQYRPAPTKEQMKGFKILTPEDFEEK